MAIQRAVACGWVFLSSTSEGLRKRRTGEPEAAAAAAAVQEVEAESVTAGCPAPLSLRTEAGVEGQVDWLYTYGAPGFSSPPMQHPTNKDGKFLGLRTWQTTADGWVDMVPVVTALALMWHPLMDAEDIASGRAPTTHSASTQVTGWPRSIWGSVALHLQQGYENVTRQRGCDSWTAYTMFSTHVGYLTNPSEAASVVAPYGWEVAGFGYVPAESGTVGGAQESYLLQNPQTFECVLTFQGTNNDRDWLANLAFVPRAFCGFVRQSETCNALSSCKVRDSRGAFVHWGFAQNLRKMVSSESWQNTIHANLGKCSAVYATGHSLGGAMASLFTACSAKQLGPSDFGYDDYKLMAWTKVESARIGSMSF